MPPKKILFALEVAFALLWARICLRVRGAQVVRQRSRLLRCRAPEDARRLARTIESAMESLDRRRLLRSNCLSRAVAGMSLLRRRGVDSRVVLGVRPAEHGEVKAHAWLESEGRPLLGDPDTYRPLASV